jgi:hypothetical protein
LPSTPEEKKPAPTTPPVYETAPSDITNLDAHVTVSVASPAGTTPPEKTNKTKCKKESVPTTSPVYETAPSDIPNPDAPVSASVASPAGTGI